MRITFDAVKREKTLRERGLDYARARVVFDGLTITLPDQRQDYGEPRFITAGWLDERLIVLVWTPRGLARRIISMRKANEREIDKYKQSLG
ncbi:BrnT family toxin [Janthinobacterium tructae]